MRPPSFDYCSHCGARLTEAAPPIAVGLNEIRPRHRHLEKAFQVLVDGYQSVFELHLGDLGPRDGQPVWAIRRGQNIWKMLGPIPEPEAQQQTRRLILELEKAARNNPDLQTRNRWAFRL